MTTLIVGASGATGRLLVEELLNRGHAVKIIVRSPENLPESIKNHAKLSVIRASILDLSDAEMASHVHGCSAVLSCLGHNLTCKGMFGEPRRLVADATRRLCEAIRVNAPPEPVKFVLMASSGCINHDLNEQISFAQKCVIGLIRFLVSPHADNEAAVEYLRCEVGERNTEIEWAVVRPDSLVNESAVTEYETFLSPIRSAIFNPGKSSRINVAHFMAELICEEKTWNRWQGRMPVIYNRAST